MNLIFRNVNETIKVLEDGLCDWRQFGFQKYEGNIEFLGTHEWQTGKAIEIYIAKENFMRHEIQGGRKFYKKYKKEAYHALEFKPEFQRFAELNLQNIAKKVNIFVHKIQGFLKMNDGAPFVVKITTIMENNEKMSCK